MKIMVALSCLLLASVSYAQVPVSGLSSATALAGTEVVPIVQSGVTKKVAASQLATYSSTFAATANNLAIAQCLNTFGDGALIQAAVNTGRSVHVIGPCDLDSSITFSASYPGQELYGDDRTTTVLNVSSVLTTGAIIFPDQTAQPVLNGTAGPHIHDIGISFSQANSATRAGLTAFTPAVYAQGAGRFKLERIRVTNAMVGVDARNAQSGYKIDDLEVSCMEVCVWNDGAADTQDISHVHIYPFGILGSGCGGVIASATGECNLYAQPNYSCTPESTTGSDGPIGIWSGRGDDFRISHSLILIGQGVCFEASTAEPNTGSTFGSLDDVSFDSYDGILINSGIIRGAVVYFTQIDTHSYAVAQGGGSLQFSATWETNSTDGSGNIAPFTLLGGNLLIDNLYANMGVSDLTIIQADAVAAGSLMLNGFQLSTATAQTFTHAKICIGCTTPGITAIITGVQPLNTITSGTLINIAVDGYHRVIGNSLNTGWANICPAVTHAVYADNGTASVATCN